jgi:hypothetical protein
VAYGLANRSGGRVQDKVPRSCDGASAAQLKHWAAK